MKNKSLTTTKVVAKNAENMATTFFVAKNVGRNCNDRSFATIELVAKKTDTF